MNTIDKNIFENYASVEAAFNNDLRAFDANGRIMQARTLKGMGYYFKSGKTGKKYDISPEECRILNLFYNTLDALNKAQQADNMMVYYNGNVWWFERAELRRKVIEMVNGYIDAFEAWLNEKDVEETEENEVEEETEENVEVASEVAIENVESETCTEEHATPESVDVDVDRLIREMRVNGVISNEDEIVVNEDDYEITVDIYKNGRWSSNIILYEYD